MTDELFDRQYQAGRADANAAIVLAARRFADAFANAFAVLNRISYSAPWAADPRRTRPH